MINFYSFNILKLTEDGVEIGDTRSPVLPEVTPRVV